MNVSVCTTRNECAVLLSAVPTQSHNKGLDFLKQNSSLAQLTGMILFSNSMATLESTILEMRCSPVTANTGAAQYMRGGAG